ncbi:glycoside hydrolase family 93 protein [Daldinia decipiens]|uniref:glycoside hydrolase family 93 protein n=1 Tax=Daldinia decipiens TaxID=326647 RepID=UPI0020C5293D|nr:glycoside hydrolase family 93 protein [Daldinia decipiens]KAI1653908.1 glycoside hydrolase family 93 protein [Daldinia decipiens]
MFMSKSFFAALAIVGVASAAPASLAKRLPGRVLKAGEPVVIDTNSKYLRASSMNDGSLLGGYAAKDGTQNVLRVVKSTNGSQSKIATHDINNAMPLQLPNDRILYANRNHDRTGADWHYTYFRISISYSDDGDKTFKYLSTVEEHVSSGVNGLWEPFLRIARDGSLQCYYSAENSAGDQDNFMKYSKNGSATYAVFENTESGVFSVCNVWGTLVASFMTNEDVEGTSGYDSAQMKVIASVDGGKTWSGSVVTGEAASHWPGVFNRDARYFSALYSKDGLGDVSQLYELRN